MGSGAVAGNAVVVDIAEAAGREDWAAVATWVGADEEGAGLEAAASAGAGGSAWSLPGAAGT